MRRRSVAIAMGQFRATAIDDRSSSRLAQTLSSRRFSWTTQVDYLDTAYWARPHRWLSIARKIVEPDDCNKNTHHLFGSFHQGVLDLQNREPHIC